MCFVLVQFTIFSQNWTAYYSDSKIQIDFAKVNYFDDKHGINHKRIVFQYTNKTNQELEINFSRIHVYDQQALTSSPEREFSIILAANETSSYSEGNKKDKTYYIFKKDDNNFIHKKLTSFDLVNITSK